MSKLAMATTLKLIAINGEFYRDKRDKQNERNRQDILSGCFEMTGGLRRGTDAEMETHDQQLECNLTAIIEFVEYAIAPLKLAAGDGSRAACARIGRN